MLSPSRFRSIARILWIGCGFLRISKLRAGFPEPFGPLSAASVDPVHFQLSRSEKWFSIPYLMVTFFQLDNNFRWEYDFGSKPSNSIPIHEVRIPGWPPSYDILFSPVFWSSRVIQFKHVGVLRGFHLPRCWNNTWTPAAMMTFNIAPNRLAFVHSNRSSAESSR